MKDLVNRTFGFPPSLLKKLKKISAEIEKPQQEIVAKGTELYIEAVVKELEKQKSEKNV